jgi:hypothetical protein
MISLLSRFEALTAVLLEIQVFWDVTLTRDLSGTA